MQLCLIPLLGPFHLRYPAYNAITVRNMLRGVAPDALAITALEKGFQTQARWQDTPEMVLPLSVIPWAKRQNVPVYGVFEPSPDPDALEDFRRYGLEYPQVGQQLAQVDALLRPLQDLLDKPLTLGRIRDEVLPVVCEHQLRREEMFEDGPATDWLHERTRVMARKILDLPHERVAVLVSIDHLPFLETALNGKAELIQADLPEASEESRERSLLDFAFRADEVSEPGNLIAKLRTLGMSEARYHEANLLLSNAHAAEALETLKTLTNGNFSEPYYLPGYALARLGQLYDLSEQRAAALRSYRGVLALSYAPLEALETARRGLNEPFGKSESPTD